MEELDLITSFGRTDFRTVFGIATGTWHHPVLRPLALHIRYSRRSMEEAKVMLAEARDKRVAGSRRFWEAKSEQEKARRKWRCEESVVGADISKVATQLEEMVRDSMPPMVKKRKRGTEDMVSSTTSGGNVAAGKVESVTAQNVSANTTSGRIRSPLRDGIDRLNSSTTINLATSSPKALKLEDRGDTPLREPTPVDTSKSTSVPDHASSPGTDRLSARAPISPQDPVVPPSVAQTSASAPVQQPAPRSSSLRFVHPAQVPPVRLPAPPIVPSTSSSTITTGVTLASPATPPQSASATVPTTTGLTAIDECMVQFYQALVQSAPKALTEGQEITLKIGKGTDGKYYFENQLRNLPPASNNVDEARGRPRSPA